MPSTTCVRRWQLELLVDGRARVRGCVDHSEHVCGGALLPVRCRVGHRVVAEGSGLVGAYAADHLSGPYLWVSLCILYQSPDE